MPSALDDEMLKWRYELEQRPTHAQSEVIQPVIRVETTEVFQNPFTTDPVFTTSPRASTIPPSCCPAQVVCDRRTVTVAKCGYAGFDPLPYHIYRQKTTHEESTQTSAEIDCETEEEIDPCTQSTTSTVTTRKDDSDYTTCIESVTDCEGSYSASAPERPCSSTLSYFINEAGACVLEDGVICGCGVCCNSMSCGFLFMPVISDDYSECAPDPCSGSCESNGHCFTDTGDTYYAYILLEDLYTDGDLVTKGYTALDDTDYSGTFTGSGCAAQWITTDLAEHPASSDFAFLSITRLRYKLTIEEAKNSDCLLTWIERTTSSGTVINEVIKTGTIPAGETETDVYEILEPAPEDFSGGTYETFIVYPVGACCKDGDCTVTDSTTCIYITEGEYQGDCCAEECCPEGKCS